MSANKVNPPEWPYEVNYGKENEVSADVLIIGGGIAGCHAALQAVKRGARVAVVEKGATVRSGAGGAGVDHWHDAFTNPCSTTTPDEAMELGAVHAFPGKYSFSYLSYISCKESYDALLDVEEMGMKFRDEDGDFEGAPFRDPETKIMFAYDYENRNAIRIRQGANVKVFLYKGLKKLGVEFYDRVMATSLLTEDGRQGARVIGATGLNVRTGEFYIFKSKATIISSGMGSGSWIFSTELKGSGASFEPNCVGDGHAMGWYAGAEFTLMEKSMPATGPFNWPNYGTGNAHNTWFPCTIVDANGKEVPWVDNQGRTLKTIEERTRPAKGQKLFVLNPGGTSPELKEPFLIPDLHERIKKGEYVLPLYADLPSMPEYERRAIFGLMIANEGKTRIPIYENYTQAGFDPDKDMLQANIMPPDGYRSGDWWQARGMGAPQWRMGGGSFVVDWDLRSSLEGLYVSAGMGHAGSATAGRYAGRKAAAYSKEAGEPVADRRQIEAEKSRIYGPLEEQGDIGWKELYAGICRIMQDYCGEYKSDETLKTGLWWLNSIREGELSRVQVRNPHELTRTVECMTRITMGEMIMQASLAHKASSPALGFKRLDYPEVDPPEYDKFLTTRLENGDVKLGERPFNYWLLPPYASTFKENYEKHSGL